MTMIPQIALKLTVTPELILLSIVCLSIFAGCLALQDWMKRRGIK